VQFAGKALKVFLDLFLILEGAGFLCVVVAYLGALFHLDGLAQTLMQPLLPGLFVVWLTTILVASRMVRFSRNQDFWKIVLGGMPIVDAASALRRHSVWLS